MPTLSVLVFWWVVGHKAIEFSFYSGTYIPYGCPYTLPPPLVSSAFPMIAQNLHHSGSAVYLDQWLLFYYPRLLENELFPQYGHNVVAKIGAHAFHDYPNKPMSSVHYWSIFISIIIKYSLIDWIILEGVELMECSPLTFPTFAISFSRQVHILSWIFLHRHRLFGLFSRNNAVFHRWLALRSNRYRSICLHWQGSILQHLYWWSWPRIKFIK